jgi:hypothetical protein
VRIVFCGVGALGSQAAVFCRNLEGPLVFVDFDRVESKNLLAQAFVKQSVGKNKAEALKLQMLNLWGTKCEAFGVRLSRDNAEQVLRDAELLVDCFDNHASRTLLSEHARRGDVPLVHAALSADGTVGLVRWDARFVADREDDEGQATCEGGDHLPLIGLLASTLARAIQDYSRSRTESDYLVSLRGVTATW